MSCLNVLKLNYIDSKKKATSWNTNINESGTVGGPIKLLKTLNTNIKKKLNGRKKTSTEGLQSLIFSSEGFVGIVTKM